MATAQNTEAFRNLIEPSRHVAMAMVGSAEQLFHFQIDAARRYSDMLFSEWRAMLEVHDGESLKEFVGKQREIARDMSEAMTDDAKRLGEMGKSFSEEMEQVSKEGADKASKAARKSA